MASLFALFAIFESSTNRLNMEKVYYRIFLSWVSIILGTAYQKTCKQQRGRGWGALSSEIAKNRSSNSLSLKTLGQISSYQYFFMALQKKNIYPQIPIFPNSSNNPFAQINCKMMVFQCEGTEAGQGGGVFVVS